MIKYVKKKNSYRVRCHRLFKRRKVEEREGGGVKKKTLEDEGAVEEKGQLLLLSYGNGNEVGHRAEDNGGPQAG